MGGNAFRSILGQSAFPRLPPAVYSALKARIQPLLEELYTHVGVPCEAPEKEDYGDLDFVVCLPRRSIANVSTPRKVDAPTAEDRQTPTAGDVNVPHDIVAAAIGAKHCNPMDGNRTSNFAVPIRQGEWEEFGHEVQEAKAKTDAGEEGIFYQVDVNVCESKDEWNRRIFFNSYGDLSMIMGLITKNAGLHFSSKGLKYPDVPRPPIALSESFDDILKFFGWSMDEWRKGFETHMSCYEWATSTKYFNPSHFRTRGPGIKTRKPDRTMYSGFLEWAGTLSQDHDCANGTGGEAATREIPDAREDALDFFGQRPKLVERRAEERRKELLKASFSGSRVRDWTDLGNFWPGVKKIMDGVRERFGGEENVAKFLDEEGEERLKGIVLEVQARLEIWPMSTAGVGVGEAGKEGIEEKLIEESST